MWQNYPSGFRAPLWLAEKRETTADPELLAFMEKSKRHRHVITDWTTREQFYTIAKRLFGNFAEWLDAQEQNPDISETAYDMIRDTLHFIETGVRPLPVAVRISIITTEVTNGVYHNALVKRRTTTLRSSACIDLSRYMYLWVNQPGGFDDMLCTVNFIFGSELR